MRLIALRLVSFFAVLQFMGEFLFRTNLSESLGNYYVNRETTTAMAQGWPGADTGKESHPQSLVVDILSIGSRQREELLVTQQQSFASHTSVRHFFNATELDDDDPLCASHLEPEDVYKISRFCKGKQWDPTSPMGFMRNQYASPKWLKKKKSPVGWLCAQRRPLQGLYKVLQQYHSSSSDSNAVLPDYLILMDDDTYFNMEQFQRLMEEEDPTERAPAEPFVTAGCLVRQPIHEVNFTFPFGGFGTIFNTASLQRLMEPIRCSKGDGREGGACAQVQRNLIGEEKLFQEGMSVMELIKAYVDYQPYRSIKTGNWTDGYCMHSDWVVGFFVNFYNISRHTVGDSFYDEVSQSRMQEWHGSSIYRRPQGFCTHNHNSVDGCQPDSALCHYMTPEAMINFTNVVKANTPAGRFRH